MNAPDQRTHLGRWLRRLEVDRAVSFALATRVWQVFAGPITTLLIAWRFSPQLQGYYYAIWDLIGVQTFAELGFQLVIIHIASHEWSRLRMAKDRSVEGDPAAIGRLRGLLRLAVTWYSAAALLFIPIVAVTGIYIFSQKANAVTWLPVWIVMVVLSGLTLCVSALIAFLEGCNQVTTVNRYRLFQAVTGNVVIWTLILLGADLWVAVAASAMQLLWEIYVLAGVYRNFWKSLLKEKAHAPEQPILWAQDIWPLQWRVAIQSLTHYFAYRTFVLVMFHFHSEELAGQMGMTWVYLTAAQSLAFAWIQTVMPRLGMLVAQRDYASLDRLFWKRTVISLAALVICGGVFVGAIELLNHVPDSRIQSLAKRFLPPLPVLVFLTGLVVLHIPRCLSVYLRAHKRDPLVGLNVVANTIMAAVVVLLGSRHGALAAAAGFLAVAVILNLPGTLWIWQRSRREWHEGVTE